MIGCLNSAPSRAEFEGDLLTGKIDFNCLISWVLVKSANFEAIACLIIVADSSLSLLPPRGDFYLIACSASLLPNLLLQSLAIVAFAHNTASNKLDITEVPKLLLLLSVNHLLVGHASAVASLPNFLRRR